MSSSNLSRERRIRSSHPSYILVFLLRGKTPPHIWTITSGDEIGNIGLDLQQRIRRRIRKQPTNVLRHVCQRNRLVSRLCPLMPSRKGLGLMTLELKLVPRHLAHDFKIRQACGQSFKKLRMFFMKPLPGGLFG